MSDLHPTYGGPFMHKIGQVSPHEVMKRIRDENPGARPAHIDKLWAEEIINDPDLNMASLLGFAINVRASIERLERSPPEIRERRIAAREIEVTAVASKVSTKAKEDGVLEWCMTATFADVAKMAKAGSKLALLSKMGKPNQVVGDTLSRAAVAKVLGGK
jgi:hypothetical protein